MKIENLRHFLALARTGNMKWAAEEQFLTRQNLNVIIKNIEIELNMQLFTRTNKGTELNQNGEAFVKVAQQIVDLYDGFLQEQQTNNPMFLKIYTTPAISDLIKDLIEIVATKGCYLSVFEYGFNDLSELLTNQQEGIYLIPLYDSDRLRYLSERKDKILLVQDNSIMIICHKSHPLAGKTVTEQEIKEYLLISAGVSRKASNQLNISDVAVCKNLMKNNQALYLSASFFCKKFFNDEEWCLLNTFNSTKTEFAVFVKLNDPQQIRMFQTVLLPKLKEFFK